MSISSTGLYGSATIVNSDLFTDVETLKETVTTLNTTYLETTAEHRADISENRLDISKNSVDISQNKTDISKNSVVFRLFITERKGNIHWNVPSRVEASKAALKQLPACHATRGKTKEPYDPQRTTT
jgi:hypothetical protein